MNHQGDPKGEAKCEDGTSFAELSPSLFENCPQVF